MASERPHSIDLLIHHYGEALLRQLSEAEAYGGLVGLQLTIYDCLRRGAHRLEAQAKKEEPYGSPI